MAYVTTQNKKTASTLSAITKLKIIQFCWSVPYTSSMAKQVDP